MKRPHRTIASLLVFSAAIPLSSLLARDSDSSRMILLAMGMNVKKVIQYEWKQRITVTRRGKPSEPIIDQIRFDSSGQIQRTTISAPEQKQMGGIKGKIAANVKENVRDITREAANPSSDS